MTVQSQQSFLLERQGGSLCQSVPDFYSVHALAGSVSERQVHVETDALTDTDGLDQILSPTPVSKLAVAAWMDAGLSQIVSCRMIL